MAEKDQLEDVEIELDDVTVEELVDDAAPADVVETEEPASSEPEDEKGAEDEAHAAWKARHEERVAGLAARFASLVAKGEEVLSSLEEKADEADASFEERREAADAKVESFANRMEVRLKQMGDQFAADLDTIVQGVTKGVAAKGDAVGVYAREATEAGEDSEDTEEGGAGEATDGREGEAAGAEQVAAEQGARQPYQPRFTPAAWAMRERMRVGTHSELMLTDPEFVERFANFAFDDVPAAVELPDRTRFMCWLATLLGCQGIDEYRALLPAALNVGLEPEAAKEIVYQAAAYLGIGRVYPFLKATNEALVAAAVELPLAPQATTEPTEASRYEGGEQAQVACFGEQMHGFKDRGAADYPWINQFLVKNCFGDWYTRGGLTIAEREMITFCFIAAQGGCEPQLRSHTAANVSCGNDREFLIKVVSNNVPFIGYPRSLNAMAVVEEVTGAKE